MATLSFQKQSVIIRFLHLRGLKWIEIHRQLQETCGNNLLNSFKIIINNFIQWLKSRIDAERNVTEGMSIYELQHEY
ncbi:hypothetical protein C0J52_24859 [Blattella germanica]|nr:hypothetical protein C0J52_24859 [Blattella germanica]